MSFWEHRFHPSLPAKKSNPSPQQIANLLFEYHEIVAEAIANITIDDEEHIHGFAKEEGEWYRFTLYKY